MTMGHYATVLLPFSRLSNAPLIWFLFCANLPDFVWFTLSVIGIEPTTPPSFLDVSIQTLHADSVDIRGNTDESWTRGLRYLLRERMFREMVVMKPT